jgi:membrane protein DedA with SNARE-associated domain
MELLSNIGYLALFIGTVLEGETVLLSAAIAAQQGYLSFPLVVLIGWIGGISGDHFFYILGRCKGERIASSEHFLTNRIRNLLAVIGRRRVPFILGIRFMYGLRMVAPFATGVAGIPASSFTPLNACSGLIWSVTFAVAGYAFGVTTVSFFADPLKKIVLIAGTLALVGFAASRFINTRKAYPGGDGSCIDMSPEQSRSTDNS